MPLIRLNQKIGQADTKMMYGGTHGPASKGGKGFLGAAKVVLSVSRMAAVGAEEEESEWRKLKVRNQVFKLESQALASKERQREERMKSLLTTVKTTNTSIFQLKESDSEDGGGVQDWSKIAKTISEDAQKSDEQWAKLGLNPAERHEKFLNMAAFEKSDAKHSRRSKKATVAVGFTDHGSERARARQQRAQARAEAGAESSPTGARQLSPLPAKARQINRSPSSSPERTRRSDRLQRTPSGEDGEKARVATVGADAAKKARRMRRRYQKERLASSSASAFANSAHFGSSGSLGKPTTRPLSAGDESNIDGSVGSFYRQSESLGSLYQQSGSLGSLYSVTGSADSNSSVPIDGSSLGGGGSLDR
jgi:hypothetical protein